MLGTGIPCSLNNVVPLNSKDKDLRVEMSCFIFLIIAICVAQTILLFIIIAHYKTAKLSKLACNCFLWIECLFPWQEHAGLYGIDWDAPLPTSGVDVEAAYWPV